MATNTNLNKDEFGKRVDETLYRSMIGSFSYLTTSRPDMAFSVGACAMYPACPRESHLIALKRVFRYIVGTLESGLRYFFDTSSGCFYMLIRLIILMIEKALLMVVFTLKIVWLCG